MIRKEVLIIGGGQAGLAMGRAIRAARRRKTKRPTRIHAG